MAAHLHLYRIVVLGSILWASQATSIAEDRQGDDVRRAVTATVVAEWRAREMSRWPTATPGEAALLEPDLESTDLGRGALIVFRAVNAGTSHSRPLLVGADGSRAIPLGGFQAPEVARAAELAGVRLGVSEARDRDEAIFLASLADPNGGRVWLVDSVERFRAPQADVSRVKLPPEGPGVCLTVRSMRPGWVNTQETARYCFNADADGRVIAWARATVQ